MKLTKQEKAILTAFASILAKVLDAAADGDDATETAEAPKTGRQRRPKTEAKANLKPVTGKTPKYALVPWKQMSDDQKEKFADWCRKMVDKGLKYTAVAELTDGVHKDWRIRQAVVND